MRKIFIFLKSILYSILRGLLILGEVIKYSLEAKANLGVNPQPKLSKLQKNEIRNYFSSNGYKNTNTNWHRFYVGIYGEFSKYFIPKTFYHSRLESVLNRQEFNVLQDKNLLDRLFKNVTQPVCIIKNINGFFYSESILLSEEEAIRKINKYDKFIIKPSIESGGGKNIKIIQKDSYSKLDDIEYFKSLFNEYNKDYVMQEVLEQSEFMAKFNPSSINTIRIATYLRLNEAVVLTAVLRIGREGMNVDNTSSGGIVVTIESSGKLKKQAFNNYSINEEKLINNVSLDKFCVPKYVNVKKKVQELHLQIPYFKVISWDIALDKNDDPVLIEMNAFGAGIDQQSHAGPFFAGYTDEILAIYKSSQ